MCNEKGEYIVLRVSKELQEISALQEFKRVAGLQPDATTEQTIEAVKKVFANIEARNAARP